MSQLDTDWVWPWWLGRQIDPANPAFVPRDQLPSLTNVTGRNWTAIGNLDSPHEAVVDPRGLVTPWPDGWSLDWWIGAEDRWHLPSREASTAIVQRLVDGAPVIETSLRVPGGHAVHRAWCVRGAATVGELVVVEVENRSRVPFAVALSVRPANLEGVAVVERIGVGEHGVSVDGRPALLLPRRPARAAASTFADGDAAATVLAGQAGTELPGEVRCRAGLAQAAVVYPVVHAATLRVAMPLVPEPSSRRPVRARRRAAAASPPDLGALAPAAAVARGWGSHVDRGMRAVVPDAPLTEAIRANQAALLVRHDGDVSTAGPATADRSFRDNASTLAALDRWGFHDEAARVLAGYPGRQQLNGRFGSGRHEWGANGCALWSLAEHWRLTHDRPLVDATLDSVARAARWIERERRATRRHPDVAVRGLLPAVAAAQHRGPVDHLYGDDLWGIAGLRAAAELLVAGDQPDAAAAAETAGEAFADDLRASLAVVVGRLGTAVLPAGPRLPIDRAIIGSLVACEPLRLFAPDDPRIVATLETVRDRFCVTPPGLGTDDRPAFCLGASPAGLGTDLTLQLAFVELAAGDRRALDRFAWLLGAASPTWTWPGALNRIGLGGCTGDGHHGRATADFLNFTRALLVREVGVGTGRGPGTDAPGLALLSLVPDDWLGGDVEVHRAPTWFGTLSYALRWHGARPALLWELVPHADHSGPVRLTVPGLDPGWASTEARGEALLAPVVPSSGLPKVAAPLVADRTAAADAPEGGPSFA